MFEAFEEDLDYKTGSDNLSYMRVYYDFEWQDVIGHNRCTFRHGKCLTQRIEKECPKGKYPALILTTNPDAQEITVDSENYHALVVRIDKYLQSTANDFSATYLASSSEINLTNAANVKHIVNNPSLLTEVMEQALTVEKIGTWASAAAHRWQQLKSLLESHGITIPSTPPINAQNLVRNLKWLSESSDYESLASTIGQIGDEELKKLQSAVGIAHFKAILKTWQDNNTNGDEEFWQQTFATNPEIISQVFSYPVVILRGKAYVGGKLTTNTGGKVADFLYQNRNTKNVMVVEIKTPNTPLLAEEYRQNTYSISPDLSGAVNQTLIYLNTLLKDYYSLDRDQDNRFEANNPRCLLIIGSLVHEGVTGSKQKSFETFRSDLRNIDIITFDELFDKIRMLLALLERPYLT